MFQNPAEALMHCQGWLIRVLRYGYLLHHGWPHPSPEESSASTYGKSCMDIPGGTKLGSRKE